MPEKLEIGQKLAKQSLGELDKLEIEIKQLSEEIKAKKASSQSLRGKLEQFNQQISLLNNTDYYLKIYLRVEDLLSSLQKIINSKQPEINKESSLENIIANLKQEEQLFDRLLEPLVSSLRSSTRSTNSGTTTFLLTSNILILVIGPTT